MVRIYTPAEIASVAERTARLRAAEGLIRVVDAKDTYAGAHSQSVSRLAEGIARSMGLDLETVEQVRLAGLLHDLGKIAIPDRILQKPGKLDPDELRIMREHPELGYRLLEGLGVSPVDRWIRHHHEWWDGSGYPLGLAGDEIPLGSRIILVADAFDAMTSDRVVPRGGHGRGRVRRAPAAQLDPVRRARRRRARGVPRLRELAPRRARERGRLMVLLLAVGLGIARRMGARRPALAAGRPSPAGDLALLLGDRPPDRGLPVADPAVERGRPAGDRALALRPTPASSSPRRATCA